MAKDKAHVDPNLPGQSKAQTIDETGYQSVSVGFHPYFSPSAGAKFKGTLIGVDAKNPEFIRFEFVADSDLECFTGPSEDQESVLVKAGEPFNVSAYSQVAFEDYAGLKHPIIVEFKEKVKTSTPGRSVWKMGLKLHDEDYQDVKARNALGMQAKVAAARQLRADAEKERARLGA